jgi:hypothetical protein
MADVEREGSDVVKTIGQLLALAAGFLGLVYAAGGGVLALRLYLARLPSRTIVGQLPRDMVISIGLAWVVLPVLAVVAIYAGYRLLGGKTPPPKSLVRQWTEHSWRGWVEIIGVSAIPAFVVAGSIALHANSAPGGSEQLLWLSSTGTISLLGFLLTLLAVLVALKVRARLVDRYGNPEIWSTRGPILWMTLVVALASVPICVILSGSFFPLLGPLEIAVTPLASKRAEARPQSVRRLLTDGHEVWCQVDASRRKAMSGAGDGPAQAPQPTLDVPPQSDALLALATSRLGEDR